MGPIASLLDIVLSVLYVLMLVHIIMSWLINFQVLNLHQPLVASIWTGLNRLLEPLYEPVRRILPDTRPLDLAPLVIFILVIWAQSSLIRFIPF